MQGFSTQDVRIIFATDLSCSKLLESVRYTSVSGVVYEIPQYQQTDFASTPSAIWGAPLFLIPTGWWAIPTLAHDAAFRNTLLVVNQDGTTTLANLTEKESNDLLFEMMQAIKPNPTFFEIAQRDAIYTGVTIGGWHAFKEDREA
jgi:hypothetical protein